MSDINYLSKTKNMKTITRSFEGVNGKTYIINYNNDKKALLKMAKSKHNDNLMYEYLVGKDYINNQIVNSSFFVKTYALFKYNKKPTTMFGKIFDFFKKKIASKTKSPEDCVEDETPEISKKNIEHLELIDTAKKSTSFNYADICNCNQNFALLVEYIDESKSIDKYFQNINYNFDKTLLILKKIYNELSNLHPNFVHNDLTLENVLVDPSGNPKIIDYGRCYFNTKNNSSEKIFEIVEKNCYDKGIDNGFFDIWNIDKNKTKIGIDSFMNKNCECKDGICNCISCRHNKDLRLLYDLNEKYTNNDNLKNLLKRVILTNTRSLKGNLESYCYDSFKVEEDSITTIEKAKEELEKLMSSKVQASGGIKKYTRRAIKHNKNKNLYKKVEIHR